MLPVLLAACNFPLASNPASLPGPQIALVTATPTYTASPSPTPTLTPTATPVPLHPLSIEYLRQREYPASDLVIEETLASGDSFYRYIASYMSDGLKQYGLLTIPFGEKPETGWPVVIFNHGYIPPDVYRSTERYLAYMDRFSRAGYIVFRPDYRGHDRSEGIARGAYGNPDYVIDVLNATAALKAYPDADPNRLGMWGHSMGGYITLRAMVVDADIKAGVIWAGVISAYADMVDINGRPRFGTRGLLETYGSPAEDPQFWASISANSYLAELSGPLQLHHGSGDATVPVFMSYQVAEQARAVGQTAELFIYEGDDHNIVNFFPAAIRRSVEFFDLHVKGP
ncbi:MAG: alpha/beta fold hydrolase [Anaerolineales bacterium]|nr:alpha/beta fold hydrolase [Anaerolineales bacterium]